ncbi:MAG: class I SAM-dependent methyltransferase [Nanoarchaeota archaeon]|nr:class I SAM-dependent methyltransferase [Nanoarchaeota archaeon]
MATREPRYSGILVDNYDTLLQAWPHSGEMHRRLGKTIATHFRKHKGKAINVVEIGSGRGEATKYILEYEQRSKVIAIDPSDRMQEELATNFKSYISQGRLFPIRTKVLDCLELCAGQMDVLASAWALHNFPREERRKILKTGYEAMFPGALYLCMDKFVSDDPRKERRSLQVAVDRYRSISQKNKWPAGLAEAIIEHEVQDHQEPFVMRENEALQDLRDAGFSKPRIVKRIERDALVIAYKK